MGLWHVRTVLPESSNESLSSNNYGLDFSDATRPDSGSSLCLVNTPWLTSKKIHVYTEDGKENAIFIAIDGAISRFYDSRIPAHLDLDDGMVRMIARQYLKKGPEALFDIEGAVTLILYDTRRKISVAYRALLNGHPLYYVNQKHRFLAASNPMHLLRCVGVDNSLDHGKIASCFALGASSWPFNVFSGIDVLEHGKMIVFSPEGINKHRRAIAESYVPLPGKTDSEYINGYIERLQDAVNKNLSMSNSWGIMLSSGIDSSTLAALATTKLKNNGFTLKAVSWEFPNDERGNEIKKIRELCKFLNIPLELFDGELHSGFDALDDPLLIPQTPFINPYWPLNDACYRRARKNNVKYIFNGGYADFLFAGRRNLIRDAFNEKKFGIVFATFQEILSRQGLRGLMAAGEIRSLIPAFLKSLKKRNLKSKEYLNHNIYELINEDIDLIQESRKLDRPEQYRLLLCPIHASYPSIERILAARYGIQRVEPHMDIELIKYCLAMPSYMSYRKGQYKYFAREAVRGLIPEDIRLQQRVGVLDNQLVFGLRRNIGIVTDILLSNKDIWNIYISQDWLQKKLIEVDRVTSWDAYILWICVNLCLWVKAIKPGGALNRGV